MPLTLRRVMFAFTALLAVLALAVPAFAAEAIQSFDSKVTLATDGSVDVVETIIVNAEGDEIRHGIYRDIPTQLINDDKSRQRSDLDVKSVSRDGHPEPYSVDGLGTGFKHIKIGDADTWLDPGLHTYQIHYTMSRMGRFFSDHDELYWNVTGNYWVFPILKATAEITLPTGAKISGVVGYTGVVGSPEKAVTATTDGGNTASFVAQRALRAGEGMSVAVQFQKGILVEPQGATAAANWVSDHRELVFPLLAALLVLGYNFWAWNAVGRDPQKGTIIPLFHPPEGLDPAQVHYISGMGFKQNGWKALTASIFDLGVKGLVAIDTAGKTTTINATNAQPPASLPVGESGLYQYLKSRGSVTIGKADGPSLNAQRAQLVSAITSSSGQSYFRNNIGYTLIGALLSLLLLGGLVLFDVLDPGMLVVAIVIAVVLGVLVGVFTGNGGNIVGKLFLIVWIAIVGFNVFGSGLGLVSGLRLDLGLVGAASILLIEIVFAVLMRAPTVAGRKLMDQIDGFRMYLQTAEANRLNYVDKGEPQMTIKRFEAILPFAIALGVEKLWSQRFESDLARNAVADAPGGSYSPLWYTGSDWSSAGSRGVSSAVSSMASGMSAAMIAAQPSSSGGSGFSGGGGSGGGGGGGGGGGW